MINQNEAKLVLSLSGKRIFILAMMSRGHRLTDIVHTTGYTFGWASMEKAKISKIFPEKVFETNKLREVVLTPYGKIVGRICEKFINLVAPDLGDIETTPRKDELWYR